MGLGSKMRNDDTTAANNRNDLPEHVTCPTTTSFSHRQQILQHFVEQETLGRNIYAEENANNISYEQQETLKSVILAVFAHQSSSFDVEGHTKVRLRMKFECGTSFSLRLQRSSSYLQVNTFIKYLATCEADAFDVLRVLSNLLATRKLIHCYVRVKYTDRNSEEALFSKIGNTLVNVAKGFCIVEDGVDEVKECILEFNDCPP